MFKTHTDKHGTDFPHWESAIARFKAAHNQSEVARRMGTNPQQWINKLSSNQTGEPTVKNVIAAARPYRIRSHAMNHINTARLLRIPAPVATAPLRPEVIYPSPPPGLY